MSISIIKPQNPRNHVPKFQTKLGVAEEEPDGPGEGLVQGLGQRRRHHITASSTESPTSSLSIRAALGRTGQVVGRGGIAGDIIAERMRTSLRGEVQREHLRGITEGSPGGRAGVS